MSDPVDPVDPRLPSGSVPLPDEHDAVLEGAGARLRRGSSAISPTAVQVAVLRRRNRRSTVLAGAALAAVAVLGGLLATQGDTGPEPAAVGGRPGAPSVGQVEKLVSSLDDRPVDPTKVKLVSSVSTFDDCDALIGDLRRVGAEHVGSRGFGGFAEIYSDERMSRQRAGAEDADLSFRSAPASGAGGGAEPTTLGTNVQVAGVDELDYVKAVGSLIYDLDGQGNLRITDTEGMLVRSTLDVTPSVGGDGGDDRILGRQAQVSELLVADGRVVVFGTEVEQSDPVAGDPSATRASTSFLTVTFVDATDPAAPTITDRVRVEGSLVSARLVGGEIRLVTTASMADLGFLMPTTPNSVAKALDQNRRSVAASTAPDWIPDWQRVGGDPTPLVPCERVHVPDTFSGVAMTSMVTFPLGTGRFDPAGTSILAPASTLYAGLDTVAISSEVWVDPIDRDRLEFDDWQTAIHEFRFTDDTAPSYAGSGIVDGSTIGQFAFGEIGGSLAVVTTEGTPWRQNPERAVDLTVLTPDGDGGLTETSKVADLADGEGEVTAVRFVEDRVLISTGFFGREVLVVDVTDPAAPRRAGRLSVDGVVGYFHPLPDHQALVIGSRIDEVGTGNDRRSRSWVQAQLLDVSDADAPRILSTWERPWTADEVGSDHHAFTYWPDRKLAMWGLQNTQWEGGDRDRPNEAAVIGTEGALTEVAVPVVSKPTEVPAPCPAVEITDPEIRRMLAPGDVVLRCEDPGREELEWPRYQCARVDEGTVARYAPDEEGDAGYFQCSLASPPLVSRVLVVAGKPMLFTDQTIEVLDPETFASVSVTYHPSSGRHGGYGGY